ncbi:hypothetical protein Q5752_005559 [Cryptotrichosporon argae]
MEGNSVQHDGDPLGGPSRLSQRSSSSQQPSQRRTPYQQMQARLRGEFDAAPGPSRPAPAPTPVSSAQPGHKFKRLTAAIIAHSRALCPADEESDDPLALGPAPKPARKARRAGNRIVSATESESDAPGTGKVERQKLLTPGKTTRKTRPKDVDRDEDEPTPRAGQAGTRGAGAKARADGARDTEARLSQASGRGSPSPRKKKKQGGDAERMAAGPGKQVAGAKKGGTADRATADEADKRGSFASDNSDEDDGAFFATLKGRRTDRNDDAAVPSSPDTPRKPKRDAHDADADADADDFFQHFRRDKENRPPAVMSSPIHVSPAKTVRPLASASPEKENTPRAGGSRIHASPDPFAIDELDELDAEYLHPTKRCHFCSRPMPRHPCDDLETRRHRLEAQARSHPDFSREGYRCLAWTVTVSFCKQHQAESHVIPRGIRAGYPGEIDFKALVSRMESGFVAECLRRMAARPRASKLFQVAEAEIEAKGKRRWVKDQDEAGALDGRQAGYYGGLGREVMLHHFQHLLQWGYLPSLLSNANAASSIFPLTTNEFIDTVLVPETSVLLIMADHGWRDDAPTAGPAWSAARRAARETWRASGEYGKYRFRDDDARADVVVRHLDETRDATRRRVAVLRAESEAAAEARRKRRRRERDKRDAARGAGARNPNSNPNADPNATSDTDEDPLGLAPPSSYGSFGSQWGEVENIVTPATVSSAPSRAPDAAELRDKAQRGSSVVYDDDADWLAGLDGADLGPHLH